MTLNIRWLSTPPDMDRDRMDEVARQSGLRAGDGGAADLAVAVTWSADPGLRYDPVHRRTTDESYQLDLGATPRDDAGVVVTGHRSLRWALVDLAERAQSGKWAGGRHRCGPAFRIRGVIEGFYGPPWTQEARLEMVDFASRKRFNTFLYAPKDDPYLRRLWRQPHDDEARHRLQAMIDRCHDRDLDPMVGIAPGLTMRYSSAEDADLLAAKVGSLVKLGAARLALLLDDIPDRLQHPADLEEFPDLATAQAETANRLHDLIPSEVSLVVCPTVYWGQGDEEYITRLGEELDPRIDLFWTGRAICSPAITASEAAHFSRATRRPPMYWDNYPVNDVAMRHEMHIGPYQNRDALLDRFSRGVMANAMEYPEASKIALATIADYLWDPSAYDAERSWQAAIAQVAGAADAPSLAAFADTVRASCLSDPDPVRLTAALQRFAFQLEAGERQNAGLELAAVAGELAAAADHLLGDGVENLSLRTELRPWLVKFRLGADAVGLVATHAAGGPMGPGARRELTEIFTRMRNDPHRVFGDVLEMTIADLIA